MPFIMPPPEWITDFLEKKAPWWLEEGSYPIELVEVYEDRRVAQVRRCGYIYTLIPELWAIR